MKIDITLRVTPKMTEDAQGNLKTVLDAGGRFTARTYPMNFSDMPGLPCRVVDEV